MTAKTQNARTEKNNIFSVVQQKKKWNLVTDY